MSGAEFLLELRCEEIPANALPGIREQLSQLFASELADNGFGAPAVTSLSTARRVVVHVAGLPETQADREEEVFGPPVRAAYTSDGSPTPAAIGFAKGQGVSVDALRVAKGPKGEVVAATRQLKGRPTPEVLGEIAARAVQALRFPKAMRWGQGGHSFVRPLHGIVALFGADRLDQVVPLSLFGVDSGSATVGHRVASPGELEINGTKGLSGYVGLLADAGVVIDPAERRRRLEAGAAALAAEVGCTVRPDPGLVAELAELVECPGIVRGDIAERFLALPQEVLVTTLRHHQKCLVLERDAAVAPFFLAVCDRPDDPQGLIRRGNEWVAGARLADAEFFFDHDRKAPLAARREALERVVFHQKLGSFAVKAEKVAALAVELAATRGVKADAAALASACALAKADLVTAMVGEFPELQGIVGGIYARLDGEPEAVWQAVYDQYTPAGLEGALPRGAVGAVLGVADRLDTLAALFGAGEVPSGSKDPFALRRAALAVVRICAEAPLPADLGAAARAAAVVRQGAGDAAEATGAAVAEFLQERVRHYLTAVAGISPEVAEAVIAARWGVIADDVARARALEAVRGEEAFAPLAEAFKRVRNMVAKGGAGRADAKLLTERAERDLLGAVEKVEKDVTKAANRGEHLAGLRALATLAAPLNAFFTDVMVLCDDEKLRAARLALLARVERLFLRLADVSRLSAR
ncbi:MAG TPA: glycine--tRNA ligase subunit beta [Thermoanaerobaculaceae bacterium]|nr:glycine--tRNA ligase subunit beta [Thermoanaerobaculaceae bacterium]